jgi:hypothetical protein
MLMNAFARRLGSAGLVAVLATGALLSGLLVGYETVGGDPDRLYRPLKVELARDLQQGRLPFWSDRFGVGVPLIAESHVAAFYPPNLVFYALLDVPWAYRILMWLHGVALAGTTYLYARSLALSPTGSAVAGVTFAFCGFQAVHATHEPLYTLMPYLPLALWLARRFADAGRSLDAALLALVLGMQWTIGHFQIQMWTGGLAMLWGAWRVVADRRPWSRILGLVGAVAWGGCVAAVQLTLSWEFAHAAGHTQRRLADMAFFSFPPAHWIEPALPWFFRGLRYGGEDPYWFGQGTTGYEAMFYVGTVPLILSFVGMLDVARGRPATWFWRALVVISLALATMPQWWLDGYGFLLKLPGIGYFRAPARYTLLASLGLALLAGQGLDRVISRMRFRIGIGLAVAFALAAAGFALFWSARPDFRSIDGLGGLPFGLATAAATWAVSLGSVAAWRSGTVGPWLPGLVATIELGALYYLGPTEWGWAVRLPQESPVLSALASEQGVGRVGGVIDNLPLRAGRSTATAYLGVTLTPINRWLHSLQERTSPQGAVRDLWQKRLGVTHSVWDEPVTFGPGAVQTIYNDQALDRLAYRPVGLPARRRWRVVRHADAFPEARVATRVSLDPTRLATMEALSRSEDRDTVHFVHGDLPPDGIGSAARAREARVVSWDGRSGIVEHDGTCDLVLTRAYDAGWWARRDDGPEEPILRVDGGLMAVRLPGAGRTRVSLRYAPGWFWPGALISVAGISSALGLIGIRARRPTLRGPE